jgi:hypothetical protein
MTKVLVVFDEVNVIIMEFHELFNIGLVSPEVHKQTFYASVAGEAIRIVIRLQAGLQDFDYQ